MKKIVVADKEINVPNCWDDVSLKKYIDIAKLEQIKSSYLFDELYLMRMVEVICDAKDGELDDMTLEQLEEVSKEIQFLSKNDDWAITTHIDIDGETYVFPSDLNKITMGEYISIKTFQERIVDTADSIPYILSIILRKGKMVIDENGKEKWIQSKFDVEGIESRRDLFLKQPVSKLLGAVNFFLVGRKTSMSNTEDYMVKDQEFQA